jgi:hypothetical protein
VIVARAPLDQVNFSKNPVLVSESHGAVVGAWAGRSDGDPHVAWFDPSTFAGPYTVPCLVAPTLDLPLLRHNNLLAPLNALIIYTQPCTLIQIELRDYDYITIHYVG